MLRSQKFCTFIYNWIVLVVRIYCVFCDSVLFAIRKLEFLLINKFSTLTRNIRTALNWWHIFSVTKADLQNLFSTSGFTWNCDSLPAFEECMLFSLFVMMLCRLLEGTLTYIIRLEDSVNMKHSASLIENVIPLYLLQKSSM